MNRPRSPEVRKPLVYFWYFSYTRKVRKTFLSQEISRFCKPRISAPQWQLRTATIKTFPGSFEVFQTSNQRTKTTTSHNPIKSLCRPRRHFSCFLMQKAEQKRLSLPGNNRGSANLEAAHRSRGELPSEKLEKVLDPRGKFAYVAQRLSAIGKRITVHAFGVKPELLRNV